MWWGGGGTKGFQGLRGRRKLSLKSRMSRVRPSYNPWARLNHYPPPSQESNEQTMEGSERSAREKNQTKWRGNGERERGGGDEMEWRLLIERTEERKKKKKEENKHTGRRTTLAPLWQRQIYILARALAGEGWRAKATPTRIPVGPSRAVEFSTVMDTHAPHQHHHHHGEPPGIHRGLSRDGLEMYASSYPRVFIPSGHPQHHPSIHPFGPGVPLSARIIAVILQFGDWATRNGHHRQNCLASQNPVGEGIEYPCNRVCTRTNVISHVRNPKRKSLPES